MILPTDGREYYALQIVTDDALTAWEASFDQKSTWVAAVLKDGTSDVFLWLVQGPDFDASADGVPDESAATITGSVVPFIRDKDNPEYLVRTAPSIIVKASVAATVGQ